jgi:hypothetical protein
MKKVIALASISVMLLAGCKKGADWVLPNQGAATPITFER